MKTSNHDHVSNIQERVGVTDDYIKAELFQGRRKRKLGDATGLTQFGVNYTTLEPGSYSALRHWHSGEDEFIYILSGVITLIDDEGQHTLESGSFCGFCADTPNAHHLANLGSENAIFLEVGSRRPGADTVYYPDDDFGPISR